MISQTKSGSVGFGTIAYVTHKGLTVFCVGHSVHDPAEDPVVTQTLEGEASEAEWGVYELSTSGCLPEGTRLSSLNFGYWAEKIGLSYTRKLRYA